MASTTLPRWAHHGKSNTRTYRCWTAMLARCRNPNRPAYKNYGARGITVCERWLVFSRFYADMGDCPAGHSIERRENSKGYEPGNCYWATMTEQQNNKRNNNILTLDGRSMSLSAWARELHINRSTLEMRIKKYGWSLERALKTPIPVR